MKRVLKWAYLMALPVLAGSVLVSCSDDDNTDSPSSSSKPTIVLNDGEGLISESVVVEPGVELNFEIVATENSNTTKKLENLRIVRTANNNPVVVLDSVINTRSFTFTYSDTALSIDASENFLFTITDKDGKSDSKTLTVTTSSIELVSRTGVFNHIEGTCQGAFDLISVARLSSGDDEAVKDLINSDEAGSFNGSFTATNGTMFRNASGAVPAFDYDSATEADIETAYTAFANPITNPGPAATVDSPSAGDVYLVDLRGTGRYAAIRILTVDATETDCTTGDNGGIVTFEYLISNDVVLN